MINHAYYEQTFGVFVMTSKTVAVFASPSLLGSLCLLLAGFQTVPAFYSRGQQISTNVSMEIQFLAAVNASWKLCVATVALPFLKSDTHWNDTAPVDLAGCDHGPLTFYVTQGSRDGVSKADVVVTFYSRNIAAMPPQCAIPWNFTYVQPSGWEPVESPLAGCYAEDSQEGYHDEEFWFWILDWRFL